MNGLIIKINSVPYSSDLLSDVKVIRNDNIVFEYSANEKFSYDKIFSEYKDNIVLLDGVILNSDEISPNNDMKKFAEFYTDSIVKDNNYFNKLRGSFRGALYSNLKNKLLIFTSHLGEKLVYYYKHNDLIIITTHLLLMKEALKLNGVVYTENTQAFNEMLVTGSLLHGNTFIEGVKRLTGGEYLIIDTNSYEINIKRYHTFHNIPEHDLSIDEMVENADKLFRNAVDRLFRKNKLYGYKTVADLSGGLDSRLVTFVANDLGYKNFLNVCYCQKNKIDHLASRDMANSLGNDYYFYPMDDASFIYDTDKINYITGGQILYYLCTGADHTYSNIDLSNVGACFTGLLGELDNAYWVEGNTHTAPNYIVNRYSKNISLSIPNSYTFGYDNYEQMNLYEYSASLFLLSGLNRQAKIEVLSPFIDVDFLEFSYRIPLSLRLGYKFTVYWLMKKYSNACKFLWQTKRMPVEYFYNKKFYLPKLLWDISDNIKKVINKFTREFNINFALTLKDDMNPLDVWYKMNADVRNYIKNYYDENILKVKNDKIVMQINKAYNSNFIRNKILAINLISDYKLFFS